MTSDKSETLSRPLHLPLSNEALSRVTSEEHTLLLMRKWAGTVVRSCELGRDHV